MRRINKDSLTARVNNIARNLNLSQNIIYDRFFFDAFLTRLSRSSFKNNFILKGGMLVSNILGIETRSTMDIDFYLKKIAMRQEVVLQSLKDITEINIDDGVTFKINGITNIRLDDQYGGFQIKIVGKFDNIKHEFNVDIATGDPIIPSEWDYSYECLLTGELLSIKAYSLESVVAE